MNIIEISVIICQIYHLSKTRTGARLTGAMSLAVLLEQRDKFLERVRDFAPQPLGHGARVPLFGSA